MYEARQNKEKVSRRIDGQRNRTRQKSKENMKTINDSSVQFFKTFIEETNFTTNNNHTIPTQPSTLKTNVATFINAYCEANNLPMCIGGHLFKCEYGGKDSLRNIVPWSRQTEDEYTIFENEYKKRLQSRKWRDKKNFKFISIVNYDSKNDINIEDLPCFKKHDPNIPQNQLPLDVVERDIYNKKDECIKIITNALNYYTINTKSRLETDKSKLVIHKNIDNPDLPLITSMGLNNLFIHSKFTINKIDTIKESIRE